ncbi:MAG: peptidoglycan DD-metalloendopeptidase family protein [Bacteroidaceae bacterium]|nr:peptidoglycan DD-metalloendopeptidase family protein [Bacteroidaceae bacterium]
MSRSWRNSIIVLAAAGAVGVMLFFLYGRQDDESDYPEMLQEAVLTEPQPEFRWGICIDSLDVMDGIIGRNELLSNILYKNGVSAQTIHFLDRVSDSIWSVRKIQAGKPYHIIRDRDSAATARYFVYDINKLDYVVYSLTDSIYGYRGVVSVDTVDNYISGSIQSSLWNAMIEQGAAPELAGMLADLYSWTIDFFGIQKNDSFSVYFQEMYADSVRVATGDILAANFITSGNNHYAFRYIYHNERGEYFDEKGTSLRRAFLKAPLSYSRISSRFSNARVHPVTKVVRAHHGVDYAAPSGTPVYSVGDGVVITKGWDSKGGGNYLKIKHNSTYTTEYMHLRGFASGINQGTHVSQGQLIGYVGSTGVSTGPHLDYRVFKNGTAIDPLRMDLPAVDPIALEDMPQYLNSISGLMEKMGLEIPDSAQISNMVRDTISSTQSND